MRGRQTAQVDMRDRDVVCRRARRCCVPILFRAGYVVRHNNALRAASAAAVARGAQARRSDHAACHRAELCSSGVHLSAACAAQRVAATGYGQQCLRCGRARTRACMQGAQHLCAGPRSLRCRRATCAQALEACAAGGQAWYLRTSTIWPRTWDRATVAGPGVQDALVLIQHAWLPASPAPSPPDARQQVRRPRFETAPTHEVERKTLGL